MLYDEVAHELGVRTTTINGSHYTIQLMPALSAMELAKEFMCFLVPSFSAIFDKVKSDNTMLPEEQMTFTEVAFVLIKQLREMDISSIAKAVLLNLSCNGKIVDPDKHFQGKLKDLLALIEFAIKENGILDFFTEYLREKGLEIPSLSEVMEMAETIRKVLKNPEDSTAEELSNSSETPPASVE